MGVFNFIEIYFWFLYNKIKEKIFLTEWWIIKELLKKIWAKMLQHKVWSIILSVILVVSILTIDKFYRIYKYVKIHVITEHAEEIREAILEKFYHGITIYTVTGGYTLKEKKVLEIFASQYEMQSYLQEIRKVDPLSFVTVSNLTRIEGNYVKKTII